MDKHVLASDDRRPSYTGCHRPAEVDVLHEAHIHLCPQCVAAAVTTTPLVFAGGAAQTCQQQLQQRLTAHRQPNLQAASNTVSIST